MVNVDITAPAQRVQTPAIQQQQHSHDQQQLKERPPVQDAVALSTDAKKALKELLEGQTIAEAWMKHVIEDSRDKTLDTSESQNDPNKDKEDDKDKNWRQQTNGAINSMVADLGWLLDVLGVDGINTDKLLGYLQGRAESDIGQAYPIIETVVLQAPRANTVPAIFVEDLDVTVSKGTVSEVKVKRVTLTTVHGSTKDRISDQSKPLVVDAGGKLQTVRGTALGEDNSVSITAEARPEQTDRTTERMLRDGTSSTDVRHGLLIVREGGRPQPNNPFRLRLDALMPLPEGSIDGK
ncbi:MAG: hypothetical protein HYU60_01955 [Magnetospirillum sp.]|nr:hypothetical protein [Magnetospirillum sp.]